jgi:hypothetical protein
MFISYFFLFDHSLFVHPTGASSAPEPLAAAARDGGNSVEFHTSFSIMRVYTSFIVKKLFGAHHWAGL